MKRYIAAAAAALLALSGCQGRTSEEGSPQPQGSPSGQGSSSAPQGQSGNAEAVDPHTTGGTGGSGKPTTPDPQHAVGAGSESQHKEPQLQDDSAAQQPAQGQQRSTGTGAQ